MGLKSRQESSMGVQKNNSSSYRKQAFAWFYELVSAQHIHEIERHFPSESEATTALKIYLGYRVATEMSLLYYDPTYYGENTCRELKKQLETQLDRLINDSRNLALMRVFQKGRRAEGDELKLRQSILIDLQNTFAYLREYIFEPELQNIREKDEIIFNWRNWWVVMIGVGLLSMGFIFNLAAWQVLLDPTVLAWTGGLIMAGLFIHWAIREVPVWYRGTLLWYHHGKSYAEMKEHLEQLDPNKLGDHANYWWADLFKQSNQTISETWIPFDEWVHTTFEVKKNDSTMNFSSRQPLKEKWLAVARKSLFQKPDSIVSPRRESRNNPDSSDYAPT